jgi:hypothetical protein
VRVMTLRRTTTLPSPPAAHTPAHTATYTPHPSDISPSTTEGTAVLRASMHARTSSRQRLLFASVVADAVDDVRRTLFKSVCFA